VAAVARFGTADPVGPPRRFEQIIGKSAALESVLEQVQQVAPTDSTVLIQGETGTGKELIARAVHDLSSRFGRPFIKLNCAAIPFDLLESELFGHERGAFTGAVAQKIGRFELADKGTLFLDEVGDIPPGLQPKLLRVLQEQEFERLGGTRTQHVDVRLVAATNRNLAEMVKRNEFRSDLYYRLNVFPIPLPPLRERREDIPALVEHFVELYARRMNKQIDNISRETMSAHSRASEFHRAERDSHLWQRVALPPHELGKCSHGGIDGGNYPGRGGAQPHYQDSGTNPMGSIRPQRGGRTFGNQEVHPVLSNAKAWHFPGQQESHFLLD
jgi:formate hydrogenlyase transcriptional activator